MSEDRLERRARWLLRAYPAAYRADRGEEIIGTLLEAVPPGRDWPPSRETVALVAAGMRARRTANLRQGLAASLRQVAVAGAAVYLVQLPTLGLSAVVWSARRGHLQFDHRGDHGFAGGRLRPGLAAPPAQPRCPAHDQLPRTLIQPR